MAPVGLFIRAEVRIKHPHFCCVSKRTQGSRALRSTSKYSLVPGAPSHPQPGVTSLCSGTKGPWRQRWIRAAPGQRDRSLGSSRPLPAPRAQSCPEPWKFHSPDDFLHASLPGGGHRRSTSLQSSWTLAICPCPPCGKGLAALLQVWRLQGWGLTQLLPAPPQLQADPLVNSKHTGPRNSHFPPSQPFAVPGKRQVWVR